MQETTIGYTLFLDAEGPHSLAGVWVAFARSTGILGPEHERRSDAVSVKTTTNRDTDRYDQE
jgi:hypothetical protein